MGENPGNRSIEHFDKKYKEGFAQIKDAGPAFKELFKEFYGIRLNPIEVGDIKTWDELKIETKKMKTYFVKMLVGGILKVVGGYISNEDELVNLLIGLEVMNILQGGKLGFYKNSLIGPLGLAMGSEEGLALIEEIPHGAAREQFLEDLQRFFERYELIKQDFLANMIRPVKGGEFEQFLAFTTNRLTGRFFGDALKRVALMKVLRMVYEDQQA